MGVTVRVTVGVLVFVGTGGNLQIIPCGKSATGSERAHTPLGRKYVLPGHVFPARTSWHKPKLPKMSPQQPASPTGVFVTVGVAVRVGVLVGVLVDVGMLVGVSISRHRQSPSTFTHRPKMSGSAGHGPPGRHPTAEMTHDPPQGMEAQIGVGVVVDMTVRVEVAVRV